MSKENDKLQEAIQKAVEDNLPKAQGTLLQKRLAEADEMEVRIEELEVELQNTNECYNDVRDENKDLESRIQRAGEQEESAKAMKVVNQEKEIELESLDRSMEMLLLKKELEMTVKGKDDLFALTTTVFRNRTTREDIIRNVFQPGMTNYDNHTNMSVWQPTGPVEDNGGTTTKTEE